MFSVAFWQSAPRRARRILRQEMPLVLRLIYFAN
jgi:hypothetical protein